MSVLGHYLASSSSSLQNCVNFIQKETVMMKSHCRKKLDLAAVASISSLHQEEVPPVFDKPIIIIIIIKEYS